jgi:DNA-binding LacI/PurR family transcriptional regulator
MTGNGRQRAPTMVDIAKRSGVALSTVSYALSGKRPVSPEVRARVRKAVEELGFQAHAPARALKSRSARAISVFCPTARDSLEIESHLFLTGIAEAASEFDYSMLMSTASQDPEGILSTIETGRADGVVLMEVRMADERVDRLRAAGHPFSVIGRTEMNDGVSYVDFDFSGAVGRAVDHLYELGHRRMALLNRAPALSMPDYGPTVRSRTGFEHATAELSVEGDHLLTGTSGRHYIEVLRYLERNPDCTAAITVSVTYAPLLAALRDLGRRVPEDFSVVAIIASQIVDLVIPPLTTIELPAFEMGRLGGEILIRQLADPDRPPAQVLLEGPLQVRSSAPPPKRPR